LTGVEVRDRESAIRAAGQLRKRGVSNVILAAAAGALAVALTQGQPLPQAVAFAQAAAALATTEVGALPSLAYRDALHRLLRSAA